MAGGVKPFPLSPPAHIKLFVSRMKFDPNFVVRSVFWHVVWSTKGTSTWVCIEFPEAPDWKAVAPQPDTQQRSPVIWVLERQPVVIVGSWPSWTAELTLRIAMLLLKVDGLYEGWVNMRPTVYSWNGIGSFVFDASQSPMRILSWTPLDLFERGFDKFRSNWSRLITYK